METGSIVASLHHTISSHKSDVNGVCFNSKKLATCSGDKTVRLWDTDDFSELSCSPLCGHTYYVHCCTFSPFGTLLATCSTDGRIIIWDVKTGTKQNSLQHESQSPIRVCKFSPNSVMLASGGDDNLLCLWDLSTKKLLRTFQGHEATVFGVAFTPDSQYVLSGCSNGNINVWDAKFGHGKALFNLLEGHDLGVTCCDFSPTFGAQEMDSGRPVHFLLATSGQDDLVKLWDFFSEANKTEVELKERISLQGHTASVMQCTFSLNGKLLASGSIDRTVRLWDPHKGTALHVIEGHTRYVTCCAFSSNGQYLASGSNDRMVMIWKLASEQQIISELEQEDAQYIQQLDETPRQSPEKWSVDEVCQWIVEIGLDQLAPVFRRNEIDGLELLSLDQDSLQGALGVEALGHRNKILRCRLRLLEHPVVQRREHTLFDTGVPDEYLCPITREVMKDPVIATDGYTYERSAITSWINKGKDRSPMTNAILTNKDFTPNRSLKMLIQRYLNP